MIFFIGETVKERWEYIAQGRKKHAWGKSIGLATATVDALFSDNMVASWDSLRAAMHAENANPRWLGDGMGAPYLASTYLDSDIFADQVSALLSDEPWSVLIAADARICSLVLHQPGAYTHGKKEIECTITEIISGPFTRRLLPILIPVTQNNRLSHLQIETNQLMDLAHGNIGTYHLFGDKKSTGLCSSARQLNEAHLLELFEAAEQPQVNLVRADLMRAVVALVEATVLEESISLTVEQKSRVVVAAYRHAQRLGLEPSQIDRAQLLPLIETA